MSTPDDDVPQDDKQLARNILREIVANKESMYPAAQRIAAAKALLEDDTSAAGDQELMAMDFTDEQLVDIIARAQLAEQSAKDLLDGAPVREAALDLGVPEGTTFHVKPRPGPPPSSGSTLIDPALKSSRRSLADALAGLADLAPRRVEEDPLCQ